MIVSLLQLLAASVALAGATPRGKVAKRDVPGPIGTSDPSTITGGTVETADGAPLESFFDGLDGPYPTNGWWAGYGAPTGNATAAGPFPYESALDGYGVLFGIGSTREFDGTSLKQETQFDWRASFSEHGGDFANHKAVAFDTQTVTVQYFEGDASVTAHLVPGSPYVTFNYSSATPLLTATNGGIASFNGKDLATGESSTANGTEFTVVDTSNSTYIIYALSPITLTAKATSEKEGTLTADGTYDGVLRFVKLNDPDHKTLLDAHSSVYPTAVSFDTVVNDNTGTLVFTWETVGDGDLLLLTWPHHRASLQDADTPEPSSLSYLTIKGWMYPIIGVTWTLEYELTSILWDAPRDVDPSCEDSVISGLKYEIGLLDPANAPIPGDFYYWGGALAATARLALIADHVGQSDLVDPVLEYLKASFEGWFNVTNTAAPAYETTWGGVVNKAGATNVYVDFGNGYYNDHHFHYGYFLNVAAVIAKFDAAWLEEHKEFVNFFARDIINPSIDDPYFPIARCRDWFAGHSWASGIANGAGSRDQESTGEAVNGYYGALLWASVALSDELTDFARLLLATEQQAARIYWHLYPSKGEDDADNPYPEADFRDLITVGNVEDWQSGAWLFWGDQKVEIAAIQILPVTPVNEVLYDAEWVENVFSYTMPELTNATYGDEWKSVIYAAYANSNPQEAAAWSANLSSWGTGNTYTNELYFIGTRPNEGGEPICNTLPQNPYGNFSIQVDASGEFVVSSGAGGELVASGADAGNSSFGSAYVPNAGTLQLDGLYVTADQTAATPLAAARDTAGAWERFIIRQKLGAADGVYTIKAASNGQYVVVGDAGALINTGANEADGAGFRFVES